MTTNPTPPPTNALDYDVLLLAAGRLARQLQRFAPVDHPRTHLRRAGLTPDEAQRALDLTDRHP